jgi:L-lactate dehydrogenase
MQSRRKVVIVGAGAVGSTFAYTLMRSGLAGEIVLIDLDRERAEGEAEDCNHGLFFAPPVNLHAGDYDDCADASVIVVTAGAKQKPGQTRLDLVGTNVRICRGIMDEITARTREAVVIMVTNPVDVLTWFALSHSGLPRSRLIGSGTVLDSARFRYNISRYYNVDPRNVHAYVVGEHGDSEVFLWSTAHIGGIQLEMFGESCEDHVKAMDRAAVEREVRESAYHVIESKGATYYAVSLALERIVGAVLRDERSVLTVSTLPGGQYGIDGVCLSLPCVVDSSGAAHVLCACSDEPEIEALRRSAGILRKVIDEVEASEAS